VPVNVRPTHALDFHIALTGFMGAGKTTLGSDLALALGRSFIDVDAEIEREAGTPISEIFSARGESEFRWLEGKRIRDLLETREPAVIALGGGALGSRGVRLAVRRTGHLLWLSVPHALSAARAAAAPGSRPLLAGDTAAKLAALAAAREPLYARLADARVDGSNPDETSVRLAERAAAAVQALEAERAWA